jgi:hypothetical protein
MAKIVRYDFLGSPVLFWLLCLTVLGIPMALIYLMTATVRIEHEIENPEEFLAQFKADRT